MKKNNEREEDREERKEGLKSRMKGMIFNIYLELIRERNVPFSVGSLLMSIMFLQIYGYIYYKKTNFPFKNDYLYDFTAEFLEILRIYPSIEDSKSGTNYLIFAFSIIILIFLYLLSLLYVHYSIEIKKFHFTFPIRLLRLLSWVFYWVLLNPTVEILVAIFSCEKNRHIVDRDMECWKGIHLFYVFLFTLFLALFIFILLLISYFFNESRRNSTDILGRLDTNLETYMAAYRIFAAILGHFLTDPSFHWLLIFLYLFASLNFISMYFKYLPYYNSGISVLFGAGLFSYTWLLFNLLLAKIMENMNYSDVTFIVLLGVAFSYPIVHHLRERIIFHLLMGSRYDQMKNDYDVDISVNKLMELIAKERHSEMAESLLLGFMTNHKQECTNKECPLNHECSLYLPATNTFSRRVKSNLRDPIVFLHCVNAILFNQTKNSNTMARIHNIYSNFLFYKLQNVHMALLELNVAEKLQMSLQQQFSLFRSKMVIQDYLVGKYSKQNTDSKQTFENLDITIVIAFENLFNKLQKGIEKSASEHIEFWNHLDSLLPDLNIIHKLGLNIINYSKQCYELWNKLIKINKRYPKALHIYGYYLSEIKNDEEEGEKAIEEGRGIALNKILIENMSDFELMFADNTAIIVMSGNKETQSKITNTNSGIQQVFNYTGYELIGQDVILLMPTIIGQKHQMFVDRYFQTGNAKLMNRETQLFAVQRSGYIFEMTMILNMVPSLQKGIQYIALIRPHSKDMDIILTDNQGKITSMSDGISGFIGINSHDFTENDIFVQLLCPDLLDLCKSKENSMVTKLEKMNGNYRINLQVPRNFLSIAQSMTKSQDNELKIENLGSKIDDFESNMSEEEKESESEDSSNRKNSNILKGDGRQKGAKISEIVGKMEMMLKNLGNGTPGGVPKDYNILKSTINYKDCEFEMNVRCEVSDLILGGGDLKLKVFRIQKQKKFDTSVESSANEKYYFKKANVNQEEKNRLGEKGHSDFVKKGFSEHLKTYKEKSEISEEEVVIGENLNGEGTKEIKEEGDNSLTRPKLYSLEIRELEIAPGGIEWEGEGLKYLRESGVGMGKEIQLEELEEKRTGEEKVENFLDDVGSVSSGTNSLRKFIRSLRTSMYEKYNPPSIARLKYSAQLVFVLLLLITIVDYYVASILYNNLKNVQDMMEKGKQRMISITGLGSSVRALYLLNEYNEAHWGIKLMDENLRYEDYGEVGYEGEGTNTDMDYIQWNKANLEKYAYELKSSENYISTHHLEVFRSEEKINPKKVKIHYTKLESMPEEFELDCWSAIMSLVIHAHKVKDLPLSSITSTQESVVYVLRNAFNQILYATQHALDGIMDDGRSNADSSQQVLLIFLAVATFAILVSVFVITPVVTKVRRNKEEMLALFLQIPRNSLKEELNKCTKFFNIIRGEGEPIGRGSNEDQLEDPDNLEELEEKGEENMQLIAESNKLLESDIGLGSEKHKKQRKYKPYSTYSLLVILKFMFFLIILEVYFVLSYFTASIFLRHVIAMIEESKLLSEREFSNSFLFRIENELIGTNGESLILKENVIIQVERWLEYVIEEQAELLKKHSSNKNYNDNEYKAYFKDVVYINGCEKLYTGAQFNSCAEFMGGILLKGIHSANIAYWDVIRKVTNDYLQTLPTQRTLQFLRDLINAPSLVNNEILDSKYFSYAYQQLQNQLHKNIDNKFTSEKRYILILFIGYLVVMFVLYIFVWRYFLESTRNALWTTKSLLAIIPPQVICDVKEIKEFLVNSSKSMIFGMPGS